MLYCIYSELNLPGFFGSDDRTAFSYITSLSYLFSIDNETFYRRKNVPVKYYAIEIDAPKNERTIIANAIANGFAKDNPSYLVMLFRHKDMCALSFTPPKRPCGTIFSDWFSDTNIMDIILRLDIQNLSLDSSAEFFYDLIYMTARRYYIDRISKDYARLEWLHQRNAVENNDDQPALEKDDFINEMMFGHVREYGDDYIEEAYLGAYQTESIDSSDFDFDMLELELDEMLASAALDFIDDDYVDEDEDDFADGYEHIIADNIPDDVLNDPVLLLKWLSERERAKENNLENLYIDLQADKTINEGQTL